MSSPTVTGELRIDVSGAVDAVGFLEGASAAKLIPEVPAGAPVLLDIGGTTATDRMLGELIRALRGSGSVRVSGTNSAGISEVTKALRSAFNRQAAA